MRRRGQRRQLVQRALTLLYRRLGRAYPTVFLVVHLRVAHIVLAVSVLFLSLYVDATAVELVIYGGIVAGVIELALWISTVRAHRLLKPVRAWIAGDRTPEQSVEAWRATLALPLEIWPRNWWRQPMLIVVGAAVAGHFVLDLSVLEALGLFAGSWVAVAYGIVLDTLTLETGLRPVVTDIARRLPADFSFGRAELPLTVKLLTALPLINVITGVVVAGVTSPGDEQLSSLGFDVLAATTVAFTVSLLLTLRFASSLVTPITDLVEATGRVEAGDFEVRVPVTTSDEVGHLARSFNRMAAGLAERERIREAFGMYVDREVAEHILREGTSLEGEEVEVTVMFLDVRDFTGFAEQAEAREVVAILNRLFGKAVPIVHRYGGHVDKFVGDGLLAVFGAPRRRPDHADQALAAACEIVNQVDEVDIGIGLNSGKVVAGNLGGEGRLEFSVIGDVVNTAARVEEATRQTGDRILIAEATKALLRHADVELEERPGVELKGKREAVRLYAVASATREAGRALAPEDDVVPVHGEIDAPG
jgi:class 3 adenylate cyclase